MMRIKKFLALMLAIIMFPAFNVSVFAEAREGVIGNWIWELGTAEGTVTLDNTVAHTGQNSLKIVSTSPRAANRYIFIYQTITVQENTVYEYGCYSKSKNSEGGYAIIEWDGETLIDLLPLGGSSDWIDVQGEWKSPSTRSLRFMFIIEGTSQGLWLDDIFFREKETGKNVLASAGFETGEASVADVETLYKMAKSEESFSVETLKKLGGVLGYIPTLKADRIIVDGENSEWTGYEPIHMPTMESQFMDFNPDADPRDNSVDVKTAYDDEALYLMFEVEDNIFYPINKDMVGNYWDGDSIQFVISRIEEDLVEKKEEVSADQVQDADIGTGTGGVAEDDNYFGTEISVVHNPKTGNCEVYSSQLTKELINTIEGKAENNGTKTVYEVKIPWTTVFEEGKPKEKLLFNFLINDNDNNSRRYCIEMTEGISRTKDNSTYPFLELIEEENDFTGWIVLEKENGLYSGYDIFIANEFDEDREFVLKNTKTNEEEKFVIEKNTVKRIHKEFSDVGEFQFIYDLTCGDKTIKVKSRTFESAAHFCSVEDAIENQKTVQKWADEIKELINKCNEKGLTTTYEDAEWTVLNRFVTYFQQDIDEKFFEAMHLAMIELEEIYNASKKRLNEYLAGEREPFDVPEYIIDDRGIEVSGKQFIATTNTNGVIERRPVFFTGWGHFNHMTADIPNFKDFGFNVVHLDSKTYDVIGPAGQGTNIPGTQYSNIHNSINWTKSELEAVEANNMTAVVLLSIHTFPQFILDMYPELVTGSPNFIKYNITDERIREVIGLFLDLLIPEIKDMKGLHSVQMTNEPIYRSFVSDEFYRPMWAEWLSDRYNGDIEKLNYNYNTNYKEFIEVDFPELDEEGYLTGGFRTGIFDARDYDYNEFNSYIFADLHKFMYEKIKSIAPDMVVHSKIGIDIVSTDWHNSFRNAINAGTHYWDHMPYFDINGNDAGIYLTNPWHMRDLDPMMKYDYQMSFQEAPIANTEDHILQDRITPFESIHSDYAAQQIWQGAVHGKALTTIWMWERMQGTNSGVDNGLSYRPGAIAQLGRIGLDLNRLSYEMSAIQNEEARIGLLYSDASRNYSLDHMGSCYSLYESLRFAGQNVSFIVETGVDLAKKLEKCEALLIPKSIWVKEDVLKPIADYMRNGGKVLIFNTETFTRNQYDKLLVNADADYIRANAQIIDCEWDLDAPKTMTWEELHTFIRDYVRDLGLEAVSVVDAETGKPVDYVEINTAMYDGHLILNLNNLAEDKKVKIYVDGKLATGIEELRFGETYKDTVLLEKYVPFLLKIDVDNCFIDTYNHWAENNIKALSARGLVKGTSSSRFSPDKNITNAEFLTLLARVFGLKDEDVCKTDIEVDSNKWYAKTVFAAFNNGLIENDFRADDAITREEMAELAVSFYERYNSKILIGNAEYSDISNAGKIDDIKKASAKGFMEGYPDGTFKPDNFATRAEATTVILNVLATE